MKQLLLGCVLIAHPGSPGRAFNGDCRNSPPQQPGWKRKTDDRRLPIHRPFSPFMNYAKLEFTFYYLEFPSQQRLNRKPGF